VGGGPKGQGGSYKTAGTLCREKNLGTTEMGEDIAEGGGKHETNRWTKEKDYKGGK